MGNESIPKTPSFLSNDNAGLTGCEREGFSSGTVARDTCDCYYALALPYWFEDKSSNASCPFEPLVYLGT